jgi:DNA-binding FadR family transcriptional regulator
MDFQPVKHKLTSELIVEQIKSLLLENQLRPGDKLPTEMELCALFNVSRTSLREALSALRLTGILEIRRGDGIYVRQVSPNVILEPHSFLFLTEKPQLLNMMEVRKVLEVEVAGLAAQRRDESNLKALAELVKKMEQDIEECTASDTLDLSFHLELARATQNPFFDRVTNAIHEALVRAMNLVRALWVFSSPEGTRLLYEEHLAISQAVADQNSEEARRVMHYHLTRVENELREVEGEMA